MSEEISLVGCGCAFAIVILAILVGCGGCSMMISFGEARKIEAETKLKYGIHD